MAHEIDRAIAAWQADEHEIGLIEFCESDRAEEVFPYHKLPEDAVLLGVMEVDALCLMEDGSLRVYDHEAEGSVLCEAAANQTAFIDALIVLDEHFEKCVVEEGYWDDEEAAVAVRKRCSEIAGGEQYASFFTMLLGV